MSAGKAPLPSGNKFNLGLDQLEFVADPK